MFFHGFFRVCSISPLFGTEIRLVELGIIQVHFRKLPELDFFVIGGRREWKEQNIWVERMLALFSEILQFCWKSATPDSKGQESSLGCMLNWSRHPQHFIPTESLRCRSGMQLR
ncbi:hypothetical protein D3C74_383680 [compost metagenome]